MVTQVGFCPSIYLFIVHLFEVPTLKNNNNHRLRPFVIVYTEIAVACQVCLNVPKHLFFSCDSANDSGSSYPHPILYINMIKTHTHTLVIIIDRYILQLLLCIAYFHIVEVFNVFEKKRGKIKTSHRASL